MNTNSDIRKFTYCDPKCDGPNCIYEVCPVRHALESAPIFLVDRSQTDRDIFKFITYKFPKNAPRN